jgi:hypothetical protein
MALRLTATSSTEGIDCLTAFATKCAITTSGSSTARLCMQMVPMMSFVWLCHPRHLRQCRSVWWDGPGSQLLRMTKTTSPLRAATTALEYMANRQTGRARSDMYGHSGIGRCAPLKRMCEYLGGFFSVHIVDLVCIISTVECISGINIPSIAKHD